MTTEVLGDRFHPGQICGVSPGDRSAFPRLVWASYLNHAGISPPSAHVQAAVAAVLDEYARRGFLAFANAHVQRSALRAELGALIGAPASSIALMPNTSTGISSVALCLPWTKGDRVVVFEGEFPANVTPWQRAAELHDLSCEFVPLEPFAVDPGLGLEALAKVLKLGRVRLVAVSAVQFRTGLRMPLAEIADLAHRHGAEVCVDGVQACGVVPLDAGRDGFDYLACGGHKWLTGVEGTGFLYVRPESAAALRNVVAGWLSHEDPVGFLLEGVPGKLRYDRPLRSSVDALEPGGVSAIGFAALGAAVAPLRSIGVPRIFEHVGRFLDELEAGLVDRGFRSLRSSRPEQRSGILAVVPPAGHALLDVHRGLLAEGVATATPDGVLRLSPHWPNPLDEVDTVLDAVDRVLKTA